MTIYYEHLASLRIFKYLGLSCIPHADALAHNGTKTQSIGKMGFHETILCWVFIMRCYALFSALCYEKYMGIYYCEI